MEADGVKVLSGENAFKLYDTYGFPMDLTQEILEEKGFSVDEEGFKKAMEVQRTTARKARKVTNYMGADETVYESVDPSVTTEFVGYDSLNCKSKITVLTTETEIVEALSDGEVGTVIVEQTPFYATMGGQQGDKGIIRTAAGEFQVEDTIKLLGGKVGHVGKMISGMMKTGDEADLSVDAALRAKICKNHSATHLLQKALREVLGTHVEQAGSYQDGERTCFDFSHFAAMTPEELEKVEKIVNDKIAEAIPVRTDVMTVDEAKKTGAMALFGEKYGETVRVVSMGDFSKEFCGGTHVKNTSEIAAFKIISENGVAAVRPQNRGTDRRQRICLLSQFRERTFRGSESGKGNTGDINRENRAYAGRDQSTDQRKRVLKEQSSKRGAWRCHGSDCGSKRCEITCFCRRRCRYERSA